MLKQKASKTFSLFLRCGKAEAGPPLSTILGNVGINTVKFVKDFNEFTKDFPDYFLLVVVITVLEDKTYTLILKEPSLTLLLRLVCFDKSFLVKGSGGYRPYDYQVVKLSDIILISYFKFGVCTDNELRQIIGTINSMDLYVIKD